MARQWRSAGVIVAVDETTQTIRIRDTQVMLSAVGLAFGITALSPMLIVRLRPIYSLTFSGYVLSATFGLGALLCFWMQLRHIANDLTIDLAKRTVECRSPLFGIQRGVALDKVTFSTRKTVTEAFGNAVRGASVQVEGGGIEAQLFNFTEEHEPLVDAFTAILAGAAEQPPEHTLRRISSQAAELPPHMLGQLFGLVALMIGAAFWLVATFVLQANR